MRDDERGAGDHSSRKLPRDKPTGRQGAREAAAAAAPLIKAPQVPLRHALRAKGLRDGAGSMAGRDIWGREKTPKALKKAFLILFLNQG